MSKGGSQTTSVEIPEYIQEAAKRNLTKAEKISQLGYVPYYGPDVAAFTPLQEAAMTNVGGQAGAFGLATPAGGVMSGMPAAQEFAGGVRGYSSAPMFEQAQAELAARRPAQKSYIDSFFIDPYTGQYGSNVAAPIDYTTAFPQTPVVTDTGGTGGGTGGTTTPVTTGGGYTPIEVTPTDKAADVTTAIQPNEDIFAGTPDIIKTSQEVLATDPTNPDYNTAFENVYNWQSEQAANDPYGQSTGYGVTTEILDQTGVENWLPPEPTPATYDGSSKIGTDAGDGMVWAKSSTSNALVRVPAPKESSNNDSGGGDSGGGDSSCVIATHAVASGGFTPSMKREAVVWCMNVLHGKWWGEAIRRGYRHLGRKKIEQGKAHEHYAEFREYIAFANGKKRTLKGAFTFAYRTAQFFAVGLVKKDA